MHTAEASSTRATTTRAVLDRLGKKYIYEPIPGGDHNAVLDTEGAPAKYAWKKQSEFLRRHYPSLGMERAMKAAEAKDKPAMEETE